MSGRKRGRWTAEKTHKTRSSRFTGQISMLTVWIINYSSDSESEGEEDMPNLADNDDCSDHDLSVQKEAQVAALQRSHKP